MAARSARVNSVVIPASLRILLEHMVDYAGLYPPASLPMAQAVRNFHKYLESDWAWMLGKFIVDAKQLDLWHEEKMRLSNQSWTLSVLVSNNDELESLKNAEFIVSIETKFPIRAQLAPQHVYVETTADRANLEHVQHSGYFAKIRMGGVLESAFPSANEVLNWLEICIGLGLPFKATAGLHHPLRGPYCLTYDQDSSRAAMYGYLNLLLATAFACRNDLKMARDALLESDARAFRFDNVGVQYNDERLSLEDLRATRALLHSIGSCSFEEPTQELLEVIA